MKDLEPVLLRGGEVVLGRVVLLAASVLRRDVMVLDVQTGKRWQANGDEIERLLVQSRKGEPDSRK